jgi:flagellar FliL protein
MAEETTAAPVSKPRKGKLIWIVALLLVIAGGVGGWLAFSNPKPQEAAGTAPAKPVVKTIVHLESFVVNLADGEERSFLRIGIDIGLSKELESGGHGSKAELPTAPIRDAILGVLGNWRSDDLLTPGGKDKLKAQILAALRERVPEIEAQEVYFTDFLVQR